MSFLVFVLVSTSILNGILGAPANTYDQQQSGDLNVRVDLKDIEIVALLNSDLLGDYGDYDYAYDYSDFTLKPITPHATSPAAPISSSASTTPTPTPTPTPKTTVAEKPWHTWPTIATPSEESEKNETFKERLIIDQPASQQSTEEEEEEEKEATSAATVPLAISESVVDIVPEKINEDTIASSTNAETPVTESATRVLRRCNPGLAGDQRGRCRLHIRRRIAAASSLLPYGIRLNPQIHRVRAEDHRKETAEN